MAMGVRDITNLEELLEVQDDDKIIVIQNGEAKLVSKANAKFGGGSVIIFYIDATDQASIKRLVDSNGNPISAQTAYDAVISGQVYISVSEVGATILMAPSMVGFIKTGEEIVTTRFQCAEASFYAGKKP